MVITRWQAPQVPSLEQMKMMFQVEGHDFKMETYPVGSEIKDHRHPFDEIRMVASGVLHVNVSGTQCLLRPGDRIEIPSNTRHSTKAEGDEPCVSICANRLS